MAKNWRRRLWMAPNSIKSKDRLKNSFSGKILPSSSIKSKVRLKTVSQAKYYPLVVSNQKVG
jgi:hypothetical protein